MADRIGVINKGEIILVEDKAGLMQKLGKKHLKLYLQSKVEAIPEALAAYKVPTVWEFRTEADEATQAKPGYPECVAMIVQIGDHLSKQFDVKG